MGFAVRHPGNDNVDHWLREHARGDAEDAHPERAAHADAVATAEQQSRGALRQWRELSQQHVDHSHSDDLLATAQTIERMRELVGAGERQLENAEQRLASLRGEPAVISRPDAEGWIASQHATWRRDRDERREEGQLAHAARRHAQQAEFRILKGAGGVG